MLGQNKKNTVAQLEKSASEVAIFLDFGICPLKHPIENPWPIYFKKTLSYSEKVPTKLCTEVIRGRNQNAASRAASDDLGWTQWFKMKNLHIFSSVGILFCAKCIEKMNSLGQIKYKGIVEILYTTLQFILLNCRLKVNCKINFGPWAIEFCL